MIPDISQQFLIDKNNGEHWEQDSQHSCWTSRAKLKLLPSIAVPDINMCQKAGCAIIAAWQVITIFSRLCLDSDLTLFLMEQHYIHLFLL